MRILVGWDDADESELISLYLRVADNFVHLVGDADALCAAATDDGPWDAILLSTCLPDTASALRACRRLRESASETPVIGACPQPDVFRMAQFLACGMRYYVVRDPARDFLFLLYATVQGAVLAAQAEREMRLAQRLREEIESVRWLQQSIVPPDVNHGDVYRIRTRYETSQLRVLGGRPVVLAGGDYCDAFQLDETTFAVLVGDASGHGMRACLAIVILQALIRIMLDPSVLTDQAGASAVRDPARFLAEVNRRISQQKMIGDWGGFITLLYGLLDTRRHELAWASAGHPPPLRHDLQSAEVAPLESADAGGLPLGIDAAATYEASRFEIPSASRVLMYTDGLAEAFPAGEDHHREFGLTGIAETLRRSATDSADSALDAVFAASHAFAAGSGRHDDASAVLIERV